MRLRLRVKVKGRDWPTFCAQLPLLEAEDAVHIEVHKNISLREWHYEGRK